MSLPHLNVYRHDRRSSALITLAGEIDAETAPLLRRTFGQCLRDGVRTIDVDLTPLTFCDCSGLNVFLDASQRTTAAGGTLRLHHPPPMLARIIDVCGSSFLLLGPQAAPAHPPLRNGLVAASVPMPTACAEALHRPVPAAVTPLSGRAL